MEKRYVHCGNGIYSLEVETVVESLQVKIDRILALRRKYTSGSMTLITWDVDGDPGLADLKDRLIREIANIVQEILQAHDMSVMRRMHTNSARIPSRWIILQVYW